MTESPFESRTQQPHGSCFKPIAGLAWVEDLRAQFAAIRAEALRVLGERRGLASIYPEYTDGKWWGFQHYYYGIRYTRFCRRSPLAAATAERIPGMVSAMFSILRPRTRIRPHVGHMPEVLRCHLGLVVPNPEHCALRVGDEIRNWREGEVLLFDDMFEHEAWNETDDTRIVFMIDVIRPGLGIDAREACRQHWENALNPFELRIAPRHKWLEWFERGELPEHVTRAASARAAR
jgi:aspartyl/asparaginyl beta-hydroxylase (cupin superfamily)